MLRKAQDVTYEKIQEPPCESVYGPVDLTDATMQERKGKVLAIMKKENIDTLIIYADREHGANFGYLTGFEPRFEEAVLVLHQSGNVFLLLGNETLRMGEFTRIHATVLHVPHFSLPDQPMETTLSLEKIFEHAQIKEGMKIGIVGWKVFTSPMEKNENIIEVPYFIVESIKKIIVNYGSISNCTYLFINADNGVRTINNANEIAHYEYGSTLASIGVKQVIDNIELGLTEIELAKYLSAYGQPNSVQSICATGKRFLNAVVAPRVNKVCMGDPFTTTMGLRGGLTSRAGYVVSCSDELPREVSDYMDKLAKPYYAAAATWYESVGIGIKSGDIYNIINEVIPKKIYGWTLNPGHLTSDEEWLSSPFYSGSEIVLKSGMMLQMDIIPKISGYGGINAEDGVVLANRQLKEELQELYPDVWERFCIRRKYMKECLGIAVMPELLPLSNLCGYLRPYLLNKEYGVKLKTQ
jgi:Xaa-Pro aminopeptidase